MYALDIAFDPFRGRAWWVRPFPGALPPATLSIPFGDSKNIHTPRVQYQMWDMLRAEGSPPTRSVDLHLACTGPQQAPGIRYRRVVQGWPPGFSAVRRVAEVPSPQHFRSVAVHQA